MGDHVFRKEFTFNTVKQVDLYRTRDGDYYISIIYEIQVTPYSDNGQYQAIDLGITHIVTAVNSKGRFIQIRTPRSDKYWQPKLEDVQSKRDHCLTGSYRWNRYNEKLLKMQKKCSNQLKDYQHKLSRKLVENTKSNTIIVGDLNVKDMADKNRNHRKGKGLRRAIQNTGFLARFAGLLTYKASRIGKKVVLISEVNTSKTCWLCGKMHDMPLWARNMECDCGNVMDRDKNSAVNIMKRFLSQNALVDRLSSMEEILRQTAEYKMKVAPMGLGGLAGRHRSLGRSSSQKDR